MPAGPEYFHDCFHGGPPLCAIKKTLPLMEHFQTIVWGRQAHFANSERMMRLLSAPRYSALLTVDMARVLMAEAIDCFARNESIARHWFCAALLVDGVVVGELNLEFDTFKIPPAVAHRIAEADIDMAKALARYVPCGCVCTSERARHTAWERYQTIATKLLAEKKWARASKAYRRAMTRVDEELAPELRLSLRTCFNVDVRRRTSLWNARAQICSKLSFCHLSQGNAQSALQAADDAVKAAPALAEAHAQRARALGALGRPARSAAYAAMLFAEAAGEDTTEYRAM